MIKAKSLDGMIVCVVQVHTQAPGVLHQVVVDPKKIKGDLIRLGDYPGDEYVGWQRLTNIDIVITLGVATYDQDKRTVTVTPDAAG